ncbi:exodeoxyribonuclease VII large subunit [Aureimonas fodinaquatilis]|uniref:Exodeoxyribonuclease 7 large subunit n=1 Tax=Aureimonas fodinaquatilis TaxID=2565783 RepID=A0A5B0DYK4_9HYPH|nr:exodeoxyribonuclease VII large subunit [Aureimonas fodinaquatilis]KAA0971864.1 exodeoxyribonuclease VII large subunit [Aureimonas fodinaquatilis]
MSFFDDPDASQSNLSNAAEYSVSEISGALKRTVEQTFGHVRVRGEISGYRGPHSSGHAYFSLKDEKARLEAVIWKTSFSKLAFKPEEGLEVVATGRLTTYPGSSKYQIVIEDMKPAGAGALMALLNERRLKFEAEGLFDKARKQPLPYLPRVIGIITSPTGAVIRDICHRIADRFPVHLIVWPVRVQGETSGAEVAEAIEGFNALPAGGTLPRPDLLIVARGGGSLEDLWGFNDEAVVRAASLSTIPLISAVGHETDWTLLDHVADMRAPTPTGAAEMAVPVRAEIAATLAALHARNGAAVSRLVQQEKRQLQTLARALPSADMLLAMPRRHLDELSVNLDRCLRSAIAGERQRFTVAAGALQPNRLAVMLLDRRNGLERLANGLDNGLAQGIFRKRQAFERIAAAIRPHTVARMRDEARQRLAQTSRSFDTACSRLLEDRRNLLSGIWRVAGSLDPRRVLERGYTIVRDSEGQPITQAAGLQSGMAFSVEFAGGELRHAVATSGEPAKQPASRTKRPPANQGDLF